MVLRCRTEHRGATDINVLDGQLKGDVMLSHSFLKWVYIHHDKINHLYLMLGSSTHVFLFISVREETTMDLWVKGLNAAFHHFRKTRVIAHFSHRNALFFKELSSTTCGK